MSIKDKVIEKEQNVRGLLEQLRNRLNGERKKFDATPNNWSYLTSLSHTETTLKELVNYFDTTPV